MTVLVISKTMNVAFLVFGLLGVRTYDPASGMYAHYCLQMKSTWLGRNSSCFI